jgi:hypothetical protein
MNAMFSTASLARRLRAAIYALAREVAIELRRLNSARMDSATLANIPSRDRRRIVKAALREHHRNPTRCC